MVCLQETGSRSSCQMAPTMNRRLDQENPKQFSLILSRDVLDMSEWIMQSIIAPWNYGLRLTMSLRDTENTGVAGGLRCKIYGCERTDRTALWKRGQNTMFCLRLGPHGTILEILWFQLKLYQSLFYSPKLWLTVHVWKRPIGCWQLSIKFHLKALRQVCLLASVLTRQKFVLSCVL